MVITFKIHFPLKGEGEPLLLLAKDAIDLFSIFGVSQLVVIYYPFIFERLITIYLMIISFRQRS